MTRIEHDIGLIKQFKTNVEQRICHQVQSRPIDMLSTDRCPVVNYQPLYSKQLPIWVIYTQMGEYQFQSLASLYLHMPPQLLSVILNTVRQPKNVMVCVTLKGIGNKCNSGFFLTLNELINGVDEYEAQSRVQSDFGIAAQLIDFLNGVDPNIKAMAKVANMD
ncbi:hypothetical protein [Pseudoalteromonas luteoviolacea]|uniref:Uncharacterized protein n=1 Tax=Pseudoalteromonas luteoviolacea S4054 TaxID=1129367 RepID=A0A0F6A9M8_9GAMM|nr:hypothetical protein [Pseudoalteromonas luteoviolacea]AOT10846.1 hypothetical protein S4054249_23660 [Pseudoalteromonas luteoviolacea]AOT15992.1 hypothetical protein S40542_24850 [Pseudoalteromonas luteoviolacea]AOT20667.1 hypothetical protein S4054_23580 [Pseudoalteromonas luteoviolacea]KKE82897.1 hypothetical protein N479_16625 [Pseudoalteromonas luteoviolacea S4054]KZN75222.1 hypothetical protein N481_07860 [Pseudoalteromonas luteoviolacea S4047-1]